MEFIRVNIWNDRFDMRTINVQLSAHRTIEDLTYNSEPLIQYTITLYC